MLRPRSLRVRIASAYIFGALIVSGSVAGGTYFITSWVLTRQLSQSATVQSLDQLEFLRDQLDLNPGPGRIRAYLQTLQQRGAEMIASRPGSPNADTTSVDLTEGAIPEELRIGVQQGRVGWSVTGGPGHRRLVWGSLVPGRDLSTYFVYSMENVDRTLSLLWRVLIGVVGVAAAIAGAVGLRLADRTIKPLRVAAEAARKVAEGGLETRLEAPGTDELARLAGDFNLMTEALEDRIIRERQFISDVSHELRTPLTALKTSIDFMGERSTELPPAMRAAAGLAAEEVTALRRLVDDLLELTRADAGSVHITMDDVDLRDFATEIARRRAPDTPVEIEGPDTLVVRTDKMRLERIVGNLVENAVMHGGGQEVRITLGSENGYARLSVADQGPGIAEDQLPRIFDRFWRGDTARSRGGGVGSGLGLAIAHENAKLIGADLRVESAESRGTRFDVYLPQEADG